MMLIMMLMGLMMMMMMILNVMLKQIRVEVKESTEDKVVVQRVQ